MAEITIDEANFQKEVLESSTPVMVDFWAEWCGPCKVLGPIVEEISRDFEGKLKVGKLNVDENNSLAGRYGVMSIPTLKFFKNGKLMGELIGAAPKTAIVSELKNYL